MLARRMAPVVLALGALVALGVVVTACRRAPLVGKGARIVFFGDSITEQGVWPHGYVTLIKKELAERQPELGVEVIGAGVPGNRVPDLQARLADDVLRARPSLVVLFIGINDVWKGEIDPARGTSPADFEAGMRALAHDITGSGARLVVCTPTVIGEWRGETNALDAKLDQYAAISRKVATEAGAPVCDLRRAFVEYLAENNLENKDRGVLTYDRVHLSEAGNRLVAKVVLQSLGDLGAR